VSVEWIPTDDRILGLEDDIRDVFAVNSVGTRGGGSSIVFHGQFLRSPEMVFEQISDKFRARGYVPLLRHEAGGDVLVAHPAPASSRRSRPWLHGLLFVATVISTLAVGVYQATAGDAALMRDLAAAEGLGGLLGFIADNWVAGIPFAAALLGILGVHEFGHYFVARRYRLDVSLPYFIPFPFNTLTGTLGAVIKIQSPFESRKALFDVGIAGPLAGLAVALPITALGLMRAEVVPIEADAMIFNEPLLFQWMALAIVGDRGAGHDIVMNPLLMAGWWGFFITALNLVPVSQLDGGHVSYALFGHRQRYVAWAVFIIAAIAVLRVTPGFLLMLALVFIMGVEHPPALNDITPIGLPRTIIGLATLLLFLTLITVSPFSFG
jgi:membrane-associated protease RseP (regulator of RpoE activity)